MDATLWDERYAAQDLVWSAEPNIWVEQVTDHLPAGTVLDLGAGEARNALWLAERGWQATAVDFSAVALERARDLAGRRLGEHADRLVTVTADLVTYQPDRTYDLVLVVYIHLPVEQRRAVLTTAADAVSPGGLLLVVAHDLSNLTEGVGGHRTPPSSTPRRTSSPTSPPAASTCCAPNAFPGPWPPARASGQRSTPWSCFAGPADPDARRTAVRIGTFVRTTDEPVEPVIIQRSPVPARTDARPLDRTSPMPLWAQLQQDLSRRLEAGAFTEGFPPELELVSQYEVSRHTVREALRRLREAGVLDSARGRATQVRTDIEQPLGSLYSLFREVEARGMVQTSVVLAQRLEPDPAAAEILDLPARSPLFYLERIRLADGEPLAHDRVWMPAQLAQPLLTADFAHAALYDELAARCGVRLTGGQEKISAVVPSPAERALLRVPRGVACLSVERTGCVNSTPVERRLTVVRGDRWSVLADWSTRGYSVGATATGA